MHIHGSTIYNLSYLFLVIAQGHVFAYCLIIKTNHAFKIKLAISTYPTSNRLRVTTSYTVRAKHDGVHCLDI